MGFISRIAGITAGSVKEGIKISTGAYGVTGAAAMWGGLAGGVYGGYSDDMSIGKGIAIGAGIGALGAVGTKTVMGIAPYGAGAARAGYGVAKFAARHPGLLAGAAGVGVAAYAFGPSAIDAYGKQASPNMSGAYSNLTAGQTQIRLREEQGAAALMQTGIAPTGTVSSMRATMLQQSTQGLVFGLHAGRHR